MLTARKIPCPVLVFFFLFSLGWAQTTGRIMGVVRDSAGAVLPGVSIAVSSPSLVRGTVNLVSDDSGRYIAPGLQAGVYTVLAQLSGFADETIQNIQVALNSSVTIDIEMQVAQLQQAITVESNAVAVRTGDSDLKELIDNSTIDNIPLNGRQFTDLISLTPGVATRPPSSDQGANITVFGERSITNSFLVDGLDNNDQVSRNFSEFFIQDAIQEFEVLLGGYEAEFGRAQGAVTNVITRSGSNQFHGRAFYFLRNDGLDSSNISGQDPQALERNEIGGTIGGPIYRDKTFFFEAFQYLKEERGLNFDQSILPPAVLDGYFSPAVGGVEPFGASPTETRYTNFFRIDHNFNEENQIFFSVNLNRGDQAAYVPPPEQAFSSPPPGTIALPSTASDITFDTTSYNVRHTGFFNPTTFLESSFRYNNTVFQENTEKPLGAEQIFPITFVPSFQIWQSNASAVGVTDREQETFQWSENFSYFASTANGGNHGFKFGVDMLRTELDQLFLPPTGIILGNSALDSRYKELGYSISMQRFIAPVASANDHSIASNNQWAFYAQDSWDIAQGFTLNLGLRYDVATLFDDDKNNFAPRVGFAWNVGNKGDVVVRGSWGRFFDQTILETVLGTPELGGVQFGTLDLQVIPRGASFYNNPGIGAFGPLQDSGTRWLGNPLLFSYIIPAGSVRTSGNCSITGKGQPYIIYQLLGIPVTDPANPPVLTASSIPQLTGGMSAQQALTILNNAFGSAATMAQLPGCTPPPGPQFDFLEETGSNSINAGQPLVYKFRQLEPAVDSIQTIQHPERTPYTDSFNLGVEFALGREVSLDVQGFVRRSKNLLSRRVVNLLEVPVAASCAGNTVDQGPCNRQLEYIGFLDSNSMTVSLHKRFSHRYSYLVNYTYTDATDNFSTLRVPPRGGETSFLFNNHPEMDIGRSLNSPTHNFVASGVYELPGGVALSSVIRATSGRPFNAVGIGADSDGDNIFDNRLIGTEKGEFLTAKFFQWDLRLAKVFTFADRYKATAMIEFFNLTNRANPFVVDRTCEDSNGDGAPDPGGCRNGGVGSIIQPLPGREIQLGFRFDF